MEPIMNRSRRVTATVLAATGLLGAAGAAAATVAGLVGSDSPKEDALASKAATSGHHAQSAEEKAAALSRAALQDYVAGMSERSDRLGGQVSAAEARLEAARTVRARLIAQVRAQAAALARARVAAEESAPTVRSQQSSSAPATHTSTGASSGGGDDGDDHEHEGGDGGGDDD
jgi:tartrate dehydratase alpha subunit/fumarate hydratase class I-like protein